jgi:hypothetical protein
MAFENASSSRYCNSRTIWRESSQFWQALHLPVHCHASRFEPFTQAVAQRAEHGCQVSTGVLHRVDRELQRVEGLLQVLLHDR